jgi:hypothetical protein
MTAFFLRLEFAEVVEDLGAGPVLGGDELAAEDAARVDDVGFWDLDGAVEVGDTGGGVAQGEQIDVVVEEELPVDGRVFVLADGENGDLREAALESHEAGHLYDAGRAPGGPEVEDDDVAAEAGEVDVLRAVGEGEEGCGCADARGVVAAIAGGEGERAEGEKKKSAAKSWSGFAHVTLLLPIIRICERYGWRVGEERGGCSVRGDADAAVGGRAGAE